mmetsp:Transcript_35052/g.80706  ORF Transcript_35052/g.80706 Transcript_35052/m.80706 type:complete len:225 (+) Transcript_35052:1665-2339(+)
MDGDPTGRLSPVVLDIEAGRVDVVLAGNCQWFIVRGQQRFQPPVGIIDRPCAKALHDRPKSRGLTGPALRLLLLLDLHVQLCHVLVGDSPEAGSCKKLAPFLSFLWRGQEKAKHNVPPSVETHGGAKGASLQVRHINVVQNDVPLGPHEEQIPSGAKVANPHLRLASTQVIHRAIKAKVRRERLLSRRRGTLHLGLGLPLKPTSCCRGCRLCAAAHRYLGTSAG